MHKLSVDIKNTLLDKMLKCLSDGQAFVFDEDYKFYPVKPEKEKFTLNEIKKFFNEDFEICKCNAISKSVCFCSSEQEHKTNSLFYDVFGQIVRGKIMIVKMENINE